MRAMPKQKPRRKVLTSFKATNAVVHWGFHRDLDVDERDPFVGEMKAWTTACGRKYTKGTRDLPRNSPYRITCSTCIKHWGE